MNDVTPASYAAEMRAQAAADRETAERYQLDAIEAMKRSAEFSRRAGQLEAIANQLSPAPEGSEAP